MSKETEYLNWKRFIELSNEIREVKPWEFFEEEDVIMVVFYAYDLFLTCSIVGSKGDTFGVNLFEDLDGVLDFYTSLDLDWKDNNNYLKQDLKYTSVHFVDKDELPEDQYNILTKLNFSYTGSKRWPQILEHAPGYFPFTPKWTYLDFINEVLEQVLAVITEVKEGKLKIPKDYDFIISRHLYEFDDCDKWETYIEYRIDDKIEIYPYHLPEGKMISRLKKTDFNNSIIELELTYLNGVIKLIDKYPPGKLKILTAIDKETSSLVYFKAIYPWVSVNRELYNFFISNYVFKYGRMKKLIVRNDNIWVYYSDLFDQIDIGLEWGQLTTTDNFLSKMGFKKAI